MPNLPLFCKKDTTSLKAYLVDSKKPQITKIFTFLLDTPLTP